MSEHVSVETARKLDAVGLEHDFRVGDWCCQRGSTRPELIVSVGDGLLRVWREVRDSVHSIHAVDATPGKWLLWLPWSHDLLEALGETGQGMVVLAPGFEGDGWTVYFRTGELRGCQYRHLSLAEAAAAALVGWLAVRRSEQHGR